MEKINLKKRILILGGTGFIGSRLVEKLQDQGRLINLLVYDKIPDYFSKKNITIFKGDITDKKTLIKAVENSDIIVNLVGTFNENLYYPLNVAGPANILSVCKEFKHIEKVIFISSEVIYGYYTGQPSDEKDIPKPITEYGLSKYLAEKVHEFYYEKYKIPIIILRLANTYGPGQTTGVIFECLSSALKNQSVKLSDDGQQRRDFSYVYDTVDGIINSIDYLTKSFDIFNIAGRKTYSLVEVVSFIEKAIGLKINVEFTAPRLQDIRHMEGDGKKAEDILGYAPKTDLKEGIIEMVNQYKK
jgi:nucleoside-diphosphate-sugar epimerase